MALGDEELTKVSPAEERKFIPQAALAPFRSLIDWSLAIRISGER
jgi:hypothetical protein